MAKMLSKLMSTLRGQVSRLNSSRRDLNVPISISFEPTNTTGRLTLKREVLSIKGETKDLSVTGVAFLVDSIRLNEHYLVGENRVLDAVLDLPNGQVKMKVIGQRYEQIGEHLSINQYLIGATILNMTPLDKDIYEEYLRMGNKVKKDKTGILELETTKS
ncbi:MAG: hypothetical protein K1X72_22665 [Pyrinomonadaceae bacterium]|nr:hypothetical protein [Pyrinomonadaceae bacterium]